MAEHTTLDARGLPEVSDEAVDRMESHVFAHIAAQRSANDTRVAARRRRRRTSAWLAAAAAVALIGAVAVPSVIGSTQRGVTSTAERGAPIAVPQERDALDSGSTTDAASAPGAVAGSKNMSVNTAPITPQIIRTAQVSLTVRDIDGAADKLVELARAKGGSIDSTSVGTAPNAATTGSAPVDVGSVSLRIPADQLDAVLRELGDVGAVTSQSVDAADVTAQSVDLDARVQSLQTSVTRLRDLMAKAGSVGDLLAAETALSAREQELESYQQQLAALKNQVAMSSVNVSLVLRSTAQADPTGFGDGVSTGWAGLVATLNGIIIALGFLLPWIGVVGVLVLLVWGILRLVRARRRSRATRQQRVTADTD